MPNLRYPAEAILDTTDYLQIQILNYSPLGKGGGGKASSLIRGSRTAYKSGAGNYKKFLDSSIFLPIPSNIQDGNSVSYSDDTLDSLTGQVYDAIRTNIGGDKDVGSQLADTMIDVSKTVTGADARKIFTTKLAAEAANIPFGGNMSVSQVLAREEGQVLNPNMELLFNGVSLRSFKFSFKMTPRDQPEAEQIAAIIRKLKRSMSPRVSDIYLKTPSVFQLTYKKGNSVHPYLNLFKQCFLTDMSVNYTGEGVYATYHDGSPVSYTMDLGFKEIEPIYERDYDTKDNLVGF